nr:stromal 70 kDa heat shock-related protein, chloroplastic-like [Tanacetum cinerariifolium]
MLPPTVEKDSYNFVFFTWRCQRLECALDLRSQRRDAIRAKLGGQVTAKDLFQLSEIKKYKRILSYIYKWDTNLVQKPNSKGQSTGRTTSENALSVSGPVGWMNEMLTGWGGSFEVEVFGSVCFGIGYVCVSYAESLYNQPSAPGAGPSPGDARGAESTESSSKAPEGDVIDVDFTDSK